ncbi:hypothetical protein HW555_006887 [Spodoptera exigua]|uniref:Ionotropic receptor n=1 Tax=Spodoptera exigua TaxID=7107 RepID=A0A835GHT8_SPOEX|nr:hypothetical protein HW555_006887 [Spodoptera exigua]
MSEDYIELANGLSKVTSDKFWNPSARFIIVVQNLKQYSLQDVADLLHTYNIFQKVSLISRYSDEYAIYKYNLTKPGDCLKTGHLKFWSLCSDYCSGKMIPPINKGSIRGCRYKFIAQNLWPFTNFDSSLKGTEQYIISLFQKEYGVKIDLLEFTKVNKFGKAVGNSTLIMIEEVENNRVEGVVGGYVIDSLYDAFIIPYAIQANLFSVTTRPVRGYEPKEFEDLKDYTPALYTEWQRRIAFNNSHNCGTRIECLRMVKNSPRKSFYTLISRLHLWIYQWLLTDSHCSLGIYALKEPYMTVYRSIYVRRGSVLMNPINNFLLRIASGGIIRKHASDISYREKVKCKSHSSLSYHAPLKLSNFKYIFIILISGYIFDDYQELANGLNKVTSDKFWNPSAGFIIVIQKMEENSLNDVTGLLHTYNIFQNVSLISRDGDDYLISKFNFSKPGSCLKSGHLMFWTRCSEYCSSKMLPPLNVGSITGCRYKFLAQNLWPFTNFDSNIRGTEQYIMALFQKHYKVRIDIQEFTKVNKYGIPVEDQKQIMLKKVKNNEVEGVVGGYAINDAYSGFLIPYTIQASLYSVTTRPARAFEPKHPTDLKDYRAFLYTEWQRKHEFDEYTECGTRLNCLLLVKNCHNKTIFTVVSGVHFLVHQWRLTDNHCQLVMYRLKEPYVSIYRAVYFRRGSALLDPFNDFILRLITTGIVKKHSFDIYHRSQLKCKPIHQPIHVALPLRNFSKAFLILLGGYCLSLFTFICEVYMGSQNNS